MSSHSQCGTHVHAWQMEQISCFSSSWVSLTGRSIRERAASSNAAGGGGGGGFLGAGGSGAGGQVPTRNASSRWVPGRRRTSPGPPTEITNYPANRMPLPPPPPACWGLAANPRHLPSDIAAPTSLPDLLPIPGPATKVTN